MKNKKADQRGRLSKANHNRAEKETLEERRQQELGRDTKPGGINKDKSDSLALVKRTIDHRRPRFCGI